MSDFETVHTMTDYYDGPRGGIADYFGSPHIYESMFDDASGYTDVYRLSPVSDAVFQLALEDWAIWLRWQAAYHHGETPHETHPALPTERERHEELTRLLDDQLNIDPENCVYANAEFRNRDAPDGQRILEARWSPTQPVA